MPSVVGQIHLHQNIAWEEFMLATNLSATLNLDDVLRRYQHNLEVVGETFLGGLFGDLLGDLLLEAGVDVNNIPVFGHCGTPLQMPVLNRARTPRPIT